MKDGWMMTQEADGHLVYYMYLAVSFPFPHPDLISVKPQHSIGYLHLLPLELANGHIEDTNGPGIPLWDLAMNGDCGVLKG